jgi:peptidoglycan-associated lipoprotein
MKSKLAVLAGVLALLLVDLHTPPADACGVKLTVKTPNPRKAAARSSRPSHILLVGSSSQRLERDLASAGHNVEVATNPADAKRSSYQVVVADANQAGAARARFGDGVVMVRSSDTGADVRSVEGRVARKPVMADKNRPVVAAREERTPIAVGPPKVDNRVAAKAPDEPSPPPRVETPRPEPTPPPEPVREAVATTTPRPVETAKPRQVETAVAPARAEVYFGINRAAPSNRAALARAVRWLKSDPAAQAVIEGHADPTGNPDDNMTLSQRRAESVRDYLVSMGIEESRLEVQAHGDTRLKYGKRDGRNRRVAVEPK